ncbi:MAG: hypothetical protein FVQ81_11195 [Candidatus Glassbacteria bacterium]|nr:hypothetical protein [Candidatus Glassbacteria bacterium]
MAQDNARELIDGIRNELKELDGRIKNHRYLAALEDGGVSREALRGFAGHQYHIIGSDMRSVAMLLARHGPLPGRKYLADLFQGESAAYDFCLAFAGALGMDESRLADYEPSPPGVAYAHFVAWLGVYGSAAELAAAFLVNFAAWGANCGRMAKALEERYGFEKSSLAFFEMFANTPPSFETDALEVVAAGLERGVAPRTIRRAARLLQGLELMYWDAMSEL